MDEVKWRLWRSHTESPARRYAPMVRGRKRPSLDKATLGGVFS